MSRKHDYTAVILEDIQSQVQRLAEAMADVPADVRELKADMRDVKSDMLAIKAVVAEHEKEIQQIKRHPKLKMA